MLAGIRTFISNYTNGMYFPHIQIIDIIEILIITVIVYEIMLWIKNTKAWMLLRGILMLGAFILVAWIFQMNTILYLQRHRSMFCSCGDCCISAGTEKGFGENLAKRICSVILIPLIRTGKMNGSQMRRWKESYVRVMRWEVSVRVL